MAIQYHTEYRLGRRGRVCRTYTGVRALIAIAFDLALGLVFGVVALVFLVAWGVLVAAFRLAAAVMALPVRALRALAEARGRQRSVKPAWAGYDEV